LVKQFSAITSVELQIAFLEEQVKALFEVLDLVHVAPLIDEPL